LTPGSAFSITLPTTPGTHVQYGFETIGPDVWITDVASKGLVQITAVPEPAMLSLLGLGVLGMFVKRRQQ
jgi:PEP-CTERM motif